MHVGRKPGEHTVGCDCDDALDFPDRLGERRFVCSPTFMSFHLIQESSDAALKKEKWQ
jgi:hypothetical protein